MARQTHRDYKTNHRRAMEFGRLREFGIGTLAGAAAIPADFARRALIWAARQVRDFDHGRPWRAAELENKVNRAFEDGLHYPRQTCRA